jgi:hypothetical protein
MLGGYFACFEVVGGGGEGSFFCRDLRKGGGGKICFGLQAGRITLEGFWHIQDHNVFHGQDITQDGDNVITKERHEA